jgi:hypothetical protein
MPISRDAVRTIRQSHVRTTNNDPIGSHLTLIEVVGGFAVRRLDKDADVTDTYPTLTEAATRYEELLHARSPETDGMDEDGVGPDLIEDRQLNEVRSRPAGWHPQGNGRQRYWDGQRWTENLAPAVADNVRSQGFPEPSPSTPARPFSGKAIAAFVISLSWVWGIGSIVAVFMAASAMKDVRRGTHSGRGLAIAALILGIFGILVSVVATIVVINQAATAGGDLSNQLNDVSNQLGN